MEEETLWSNSDMETAYARKWKQHRSTLSLTLKFPRKFRNQVVRYNGAIMREKTKYRKNTFGYRRKKLNEEHVFFETFILKVNNIVLSALSYAVSSTFSHGLNRQSYGDNSKCKMKFLQQQEKKHIITYICGRI